MIIHFSGNVSEYRRIAKQRLLRLTNNIWVFGARTVKSPPAVPETPF